jgi:hypothetical protein
MFQAPASVCNSEKRIVIFLQEENFEFDSQLKIILKHLGFLMGNIFSTLYINFLLFIYSIWNSLVRT